MTSSNAVIAEIKDVLRGYRQSHVDELTGEDDFVELLSLESVEVVDIVLTLEERFDIEFGDVPEALVSLDALAKHVELLIGA